ncbi:MAG: hypothetical protein AB7P17_11400 [Nitrospirales bacterium]
MYTIEMLPAALGDCLWIEYGDRNNPSRILIDGGTVGTIDCITSKIHAVAAREKRCRFELVVVTHIDADHIEGIIKLLGQPSLPVDIEEIWFNGNDHLPKPDERDEEQFLGGKQGDFLSALIRKRGLPWNTYAWNGGPVYVPPRSRGKLPKCTLPGGMELTLLSPTYKELLRLSQKWEDELTKAGLVGWEDEEILEALLASRKLAPEEEFLGEENEGFLGDEVINVEKLVDAKKKEDASPANGSSIAFVGSFNGKQCLFAGDAYSPVLKQGVERLLEETNAMRLKLDAFKVPHHGSRGNIHDDLLATLNCHTYLISTDGTRFKHPDVEAIARLVGGKWRPNPKNDQPIQLHFNYRTLFNGKWDDEALCRDWNYTVVFPKEKGQNDDLDHGLMVSIEP